MSTHVLRTREHVCKVMKNPRAREKSFKPGVIQDGWGVGGGILSDTGVLGRNMWGGRLKSSKWYSRWGWVCQFPQRHLVKPLLWLEPDRGDSQAGLKTA